ARCRGGRHRAHRRGRQRGGVRLPADGRDRRRAARPAGRGLPVRGEPPGRRTTPADRRGDGHQGAPRDPRRRGPATRRRRPRRDRRAARRPGLGLDGGRPRRRAAGGRGVTERAQVAQAGRVVVKVGSSSLTTAEGGIDPVRLAALVDALAGVRARGAEVVLVSSGAIAAGLAPLDLPRRPRDLATQQAAASVGQGLLVQPYNQAFARHGIVAGHVLLTVDDVTRRSHYRNAYRTFAKLLELGVLPVVNENDTVATSEIRFGDNDRLAALVAHLVHADLLLLLSDVDGLYDGNPARGD